MFRPVANAGPQLAVAAALLALALALFCAWMHPAILDPANVGWLLDGHDRGQSAIGLAAYLRAGHWPALHQPLVAAPGLPLLFTDSIPLLGAVLGAIAPLLPAGLQFIGPWLLLCLVLHAGFAWALLNRHAPDPLAAWLGTALLTLMPALLNRYGHASLCAQWLILWALWVHVDPARSRRAVWWMAVLGVAALVHSYLLLMCAAIWGSGVMRALIVGEQRGRTLAGAAAVLATVTALVAANGVFGGPFLSTDTYGAFPMALDAWWNPANPTYSALLPSSPDDHARGYEGLQYLGAGLIALVVATPVLLIRHDAGAQSVTMARLRWLLPAFAVLALLAIGPQPLWRGIPLVTLHLPGAVTHLLDPVRAAGRLVWPATYVLAYVAILGACRLNRARLLLAGALALQIIDLTPMIAAIRATSTAATDPRAYHRTHDPRWDRLIAQAATIDFQPPTPFADLGLMEEITWRAIRACRPTAYTYAARETRAMRARIDAGARAFQGGRIDPSRLYVLLDGKVPPPLARRIRYLDGIAIIPASVPAPPPAACR